MNRHVVDRSTLRENGQVTLPPRVREALNIESGDTVEFELTASGQVVVRGLKMIPANQAWFWTESWQRGEREASEDIAAGRVETFKDAQTFLDSISPDEA
jgi:AbrB family looped-hinge helix DNA binding protein